MNDDVLLDLNFEAEVIYWRGPSPFFYAPTPPAESAAIGRVARAVSYGWGVIPVTATLSGVTFRTSLFPKDGSFLLPLKVAVRKATGVTAGDTIQVRMVIAQPG
jgi:hypothetical protein